MPVLFPILRMKTVNCLSVYFVFINCITSKRGVLIRAAHNNAPVYGRGTQNNSVAKHSLILEDAATSETVENWLREYDTEALTVFRNVAEAEWSYLTDMTESNKDNLVSTAVHAFHDILPNYLFMLEWRIYSALSFHSLRAIL